MIGPEPLWTEGEGLPFLNISPSCYSRIETGILNKQVIHKFSQKGGVMRLAFTRLLVVILFVGALASAQRRNITEKDLFDFTWIGDPQVSPDGSRVAFVNVTVNEKKDGYNTSIWTISTTGADEPHRLTSGNR
ncbi:MAG TPA: hypothetical protein VEV81_11340, partial [Pyrinomonadaceae bacterium]|nr:hypothetical protein [Pyrinomonadaceae bacterium]